MADSLFLAVLRPSIPMSRKFIPSAQMLLGGSVLFLVLGVFFGNVCVATGQGLLLVALVLAAIEGRPFSLDWRGLRGSGWCLLAMTAAALLSILANLETIDDPIDFVKKLRYPVVALLLVLLCPFREGAPFAQRDRDIYVAGWLVSLVLAILFGLFDYFFGEHTGKNAARLSGLYGQVMTFAYGLQFSVITLFVFVMRPGLFRSLTRIPWIVTVPCLVLAAIALYLTFTRGAMLGVVTGVTLFALMKVRWLVLPIAICIVVAGVFSWKQGTRYLDMGKDTRVSHWQGAALTFLKYPVVGVGYRNYEVRSAELKKELGMPPDKKFKKQRNAEDGFLTRHAHNNYLEALASTGILGGLAFLGFCSCWLREAWRHRETALLFVPLIGAFLVSGFFENTFFDSELLSAILLVWCFSQVLFDREDRDPPVTPTSSRRPASPSE